ncbi:MAG: hypothetical protein AUK48_06840 [Oscillatoriales cyanobacterium CG2_30_44_21]|nr:MAG: hypothetical protein AUK48_06840 [Oscillatoriales cyanobacterium CG2_30_44_21]
MKIYWILIFAGFFLFKSQPSLAQSTVQDLPNGIYRLCSNSPNGTEKAGYCLSFRKTGNKIVGGYSNPAQGDRGICVSGQVSGNTIIGQALEMYESGLVPRPIRIKSPYSGDKFVNWDEFGFLSVRQQQAINIKRSGGYLTGYRYPSATLKLGNFYRYPQPRYTPPSSCQP